MAIVSGFGETNTLIWILLFFFPEAIDRMTMYYNRIDQAMINQCVGVYMKKISKGQPLFVLSLTKYSW